MMHGTLLYLPDALYFVDLGAVTGVRLLTTSPLGAQRRLHDECLDLTMRDTTKLLDGLRAVGRVTLNAAAQRGIMHWLAVHAEEWNDDIAWEWAAEAEAEWEEQVRCAADDAPAARNFWQWADGMRASRQLMWEDIETAAGLRSGVLSQAATRGDPPTEQHCRALATAFALPLESVLYLAHSTPGTPPEWADVVAELRTWPVKELSRVLQVLRESPAVQVT